MAHKKGQGSSRNGRDSNPKMLGIKLYGGQYAKPGSIICRQNGTKWQPGKNVGVGSDWTIFSLIEGTVKFDREGRRINVVPARPPPPAADGPSTESVMSADRRARRPDRAARDGVRDVRGPGDDLRQGGRRRQRLPELPP